MTGPASVSAAPVPSLGRILIVDDDHDILVAARLLLKRHYPFVRTESDPSLLPRLLAEERFDVVLLDMNFAIGASSGEEGLAWLTRILEADPRAAVVMITAYGDVDLAVEAMKRGAADFVVKPWQNEKLLATLRRAMEQREAMAPGGPAATAPAAPGGGVIGAGAGSAMIGRSRAMQAVWDLIRRAGPTDANVLVTGENGTGKELVAREIHRFSGRASRIFLPVDVGEIPETLFESEMFGHRKGSFTGAKEDRVGRFQHASGGTLFLDEIGNLPLHLQAKMLSVLERREVRPVGADKAISVDVRLISATNRPLVEMQSEESFRQDLLYRINTVEIHLPPLRERREDIPALVEHFQAIFSRKYNLPEKPLAEGARERLMIHAWPGNVRELRHAVERATILSRGAALGADDFPLAATLTPAAGDAGAAAIGLDSYNLDTVESAVIEKALKKNSGNVSRTARDLGLTRASLYRRMEKYGL